MLTPAQKNILLQDYDQNIGILCLNDEYSLLEVRQDGAMLMCRFQSDEEWCHFSYNAGIEFIRQCFSRYRKPEYVVLSDAGTFAKLRQERQVEWSIDCLRFFLRQPGDPEITSGIEPLLPDQLPLVYQHSKYQQFLDMDYLGLRLKLGGGYCIRADGKPVAWVMTHDDGSVGMVHVLDEYRGRGYARKLVSAMAKSVAASGRPVFAHIEPANTASVRLFTSMGFEQKGLITWARLR